MLIVDDIPTNVRLLEARLVAEYYEVLTASSGREALAICERAEIDIVLLDVMMPEMDGFEVCALLKANPRTQHIPVLMITALDQPSDRVRGLDVGADDFLTKPVDDVQLMARVKSLVRLKNLTDELRTRAQTSQQIAVEDAIRAMEAISAEGGKILIIDSDPRSAERVRGYRAVATQATCWPTRPTRCSSSPATTMSWWWSAWRWASSTRCGCARRCARSSIAARCRSS